MMDYDIKIKKASEVTLYGTCDDTIVVPSTVKFDTDRRKADIEIDDETPVKVGMPNIAEKIELEVKDSTVILKDLSYEDLEIDGKGNIVIDAENITGSLQINLVGGEAILRLPSGYRFQAVNKGRSTTIENGLTSDPDATDIVEFNGKDSVLKIVEK